MMYFSGLIQYNELNVKFHSTCSNKLNDEKIHIIEFTSRENSQHMFKLLLNPFNINFLNLQFSAIGSIS